MVCLLVRPAIGARASGVLLRERLTSIDALVDEEITGNHIPGAVVLIGEGDAIL